MLAADTRPPVVPRVRKLPGERLGVERPAWQAWQAHWPTTGLRAFERRLAGEADTGRFCHGASVTVADICLASVVVVRRALGIEVAGTPHVDRVVAACGALPAFAGAEPGLREGAPRRSRRDGLEPEAGPSVRRRATPPDAPAP